jgi:crossover junction endodeoxyribonuclease RuvC
MTKLRGTISAYSVFATHVFIERVGAMPKQGVASTFRFGYAAGAIHGLLTAFEIPLSFVTPQTWRRAMAVSGVGKDACRARACELFPTQADQFARQKDEHRADAALIASYGHRLFRRGKPDD